MTTAHVSRMLVERYELFDKILKLQQFISSNPIFVALPQEEKHDMEMQLMHMKRYKDVLERRIHRAESQAPKLADEPTRNPQTMPPPDMEPADTLITSTQEIRDALATPAPAAEPIASIESGRGGDYAGGGASGSWDSGSSSSDSGSSSSSDSGSSPSGSD